MTTLPPSCKLLTIIIWVQKFAKLLLDNYFLGCQTSLGYLIRVPFIYLNQNIPLPFVSVVLMHEETSIHGSEGEEQCDNHGCGPST
ncbi:hypothetical protein CDL12_12379 [Handroanthus impetiginosus]|uniref:Uncharacterized protein n=1 Tax=Handroanthus impetiginosus TaxID=429701 RepID=A0A2G9HBS3_9LAMI|nr:hypothetical protein CDL12_12379 [Handroanthus impetiginosus]